MEMSEIQPEIEASWKSVLQNEFQKDYFKLLKTFLIEEKKKFKVFPPGNHIFSAFNLTPLPDVKVVIIGQDPYHGPGQAHGLCFSVPEGIKPPPSLQNIYKELFTDLGIKIPGHGNLGKWAKQGVFLLNATLTVRENQAGSHQNQGWENFTDAVITKISDEKENVVFLLWGKFAQAKEVLINKNRGHLVLKSAHPSFFSVKNFFGCRHFSKTNGFLKEKGIPEIDWSL